MNQSFLRNTLQYDKKNNNFSNQSISSISSSPRVSHHTPLHSALKYKGRIGAVSQLTNSKLASVFFGGGEKVGWEGARGRGGERGGGGRGWVGRGRGGGGEKGGEGRPGR